MKAIVLLSSVVLSLTTMAKSPVTNIVKVSDGTSAYCKKKSDVFRHRMQAYSLKSLKVKEIDNSLKFDLSINMLECRDDGAGKVPYHFAKSNIFNDFSYDVLTGVNSDGTRVFNHVTAKTSKVSLKLYKDGVYTLIDEPVGIEGESLETNFSSEFPISELLKDQDLEMYEEGKVVRTSFDFMMMRNLEFKSNRGSSKQNIRYGAFRVHLLVKKIDGELKILKVFSRSQR